MLNFDIAAAAEGGDERYVIFNLAENVFAVNCKYVVSIEKSAKITEMSNAPPGVRGIGYYKNEAINIFDLRAIFGYQSHEDYVEYKVNISRHIMEHEAWAEETKQTGSAFGFTSDEHECDLGKWLNNYKTDNLTVQNLIKRIEPIHEQFHRFADKMSGYEWENSEEAEKFAAEVDAVKTALVNSLNDLNDALLKLAKELPIILKTESGKVGIIVDDVESVDSMDEIQTLPPAALATHYIKRLGFRKKDRQITLILEAEMLA
jgi:chemotaxis signal transduction protein